jgi:uncharacterized YccA/Bax inhibitor family protein
VKSSNPVLGRNWAVPAGSAPPAAPYAPGPAPMGYDAYTPIAPVRERMTVEDVVIRTIGLLAVVFVAGAASWVLLPDSVSPLFLFGALGVGLVLGLVISFGRVTNPAAIVPYAAVEGVLLGVISRFYENAYSGIVIQAVVATFGVFFGMAVLYRFKVIRATPRFTKVLMGAVIGLVALMAVNFLLSMLRVNGGSGLGLRDYGTTGHVGALPIVFSLVCIVVAALTFVMDFAAIEAGVQQGVDRRFAWYASFGILVGLVWLYLEILRLLGYARR